MATETPCQTSDFVNFPVYQNQKYFWNEHFCSCFLLLLFERYAGKEVMLWNPGSGTLLMFFCLLQILEAVYVVYLLQIAFAICSIVQQY